MKKQVDLRKAVLWGSVAWIAHLVIGNLIWMNPWSVALNQKYTGHPTIKTFEFVGGISNWLLLTFGFGLLLTFFFIALYLRFYESIPGTGWKKGLVFGLIVSVLKAVPEVFNQWMLFVYPTELIVQQLINTLIGTILFFMVLAWLYHRFKVVQIPAIDRKNKIAPSVVST